MSSEKKKPVLAVYWADTRVILSFEERKALLQDAVVESITMDEVLLRSSSGRLIIVESVDEGRLFCALCKTPAVRNRYSKECPEYAICVLRPGENKPSSAVA